MAKEILDITGMTCASCAKAVERHVGKVEGISSVNVNIATEKMTVEFDDTKADKSKIKDAVIKAGYGVKESDESIREISLPIAGMTCASCVRAVERAIGKLDGIREVSVNLATEKARIAYYPSKIRLSQIRDAISRAGYEPLEIENTNQADYEKAHRENEIKILRVKFLISALFTLPLFYIAMGHMVGLPLPRIIDPNYNPLNFGLIQLLLVIPAMAAGYKFYTIGFTRLLRREPNMDSLIAVGTAAAFLYGVYAIIQILNGNEHYSKDLYFETTGVIITLILLGKHLESITKGRTSEAIKKLMGLAPKTAIVIHEGKEMVIPSMRWKQGISFL